MNQFVDLFAEHGLLAVFLGVFIEQVGAPIPAFPFLLLAGMDGIDDGAFALLALVVAAVASMLADLVWFWAGRRHGQRVLSLLCKISISPDSCVRQSELSFARRGVATLVISKFVPGLSTLAPPMAGALGMSTRTFVIFNLAGSALWAGSGIALGIIFHRQIQSLLTVLGELGNAALVVVAMALGLYIALRLYRRLRLSRIKAKLPQMLPAELAQRMREGEPVVVLDVRAVGAGLVLSEGIAGARRIDIAALERDCPMDWPTDALVVTYCACPNDASAVKAAQSLNKRGRKAHVLNGGIEGWVRAGLPLEAVQSVD
ncbi:VTT domain-containing protein [Acidovorax carolinensis]|uniref:VTT domain-containing protein n=1 Tax=Acidovorax carolinensis TaxID=553814 RepID=UPI000B3451F0|nr:VTT domain-containing protein [Acidovorax carolinensis]ART48539.1 hypothetical protein CBP33_10685 [Acidovorax carolinensis]